MNIRSQFLLTGLLLMMGMGAVAGPVGSKEWTDPASGMVFVVLPKACFQMGAAPIRGYGGEAIEEVGFNGMTAMNEGPVHEVCLDEFYMGKFEVTADEWLALMEAAPPGGDGNEPVAGISWDDANEFARRLTEKSGGKHRYRLPTEAEWEYACRGGAEDIILEAKNVLVGKAWYSYAPARRDKPQSVGLLQANGFGLHDMLGNVWEWTLDSYLTNAYSRHSLYQPLVRDSAASERVIRGGSIRTEHKQVRCAKRGHFEAALKLNVIGFRLVREK